MQSHANCKNCQKCIFAQNYIAIIAFTLAVIVWVWNPAPSSATQLVCYSLINNNNRITSTYTGAYQQGSTFFNGMAVTLPIVRDYCHDSGSGYYYNAYYSTLGQNANILATRAIALPDASDFTDGIQSWDMSTVANKLGCSAANGNALSFPGINQIIALLPQSPTGMRIPTLITKMAGENSLAGNLAIELYSGAWQFLGILTSFKLFKVFFKGG